MKPKLFSTQWIVVFERLSGATQRLAELASILDRCDETEAACDEARKIELDLRILESRLRHLRAKSQVQLSVSA